MCQILCSLDLLSNLICKYFLIFTPFDELGIGICSRFTLLVMVDLESEAMFAARPRAHAPKCFSVLPLWDASPGSINPP